LPISASAAPEVLDASTAEFSFIDASDVLESSEAGESFEYLNVATIGGVVIDATLTVDETFNLVGTTEPFFFLSDDFRTFVNTTYGPTGSEPDGREELVENGCYLDSDEWGGPIETTLASDYLVGTDAFDSTTAWNAGSKFLVGSSVLLADEAIDDDADEDRAINTEIESCSGYDFFSSEDYAFPGYVRFTVSFTSGGDPVLLENLTLSVFDIDGGQYVRFFSPTPDSYRVFDTSLLDICGPVSLALTPCDPTSSGEYAGSATDLASFGGATIEFYGDDSSDDGEVYEWAAEVTYTEPRSSVTYQYGVREGGGGSLEVRVDQINWDGDGSGSGGSESTSTSPVVLARTGVAGNGWLLLSGALLLVGAALLRSSRASRAGG
jgi:LPXTG-motif cell wall-anchored protein